MPTCAAKGPRTFIEWIGAEPTDRRVTLDLAPPGTPAPPWTIASSLHADAAPTLETMRGKVIVAHAFQMLCPGCVQYALPQMMKVRELFDEAAVAVTQGALDKLDRDQLQAVIGHEFSHILNGDMRLNIRLIDCLD